MVRRLIQTLSIRPNRSDGASTSADNRATSTTILLCCVDDRNASTHVKLVKKVLLWMLGIVGVLAIGLVVLAVWWFRPLDHTVPHGDECLDTPQGEYLRCWDILVPSDLETPVPLLLDLHGYSSSKTGQRGLSGFEEIAVREGFVVAWPQGIQRSWNAGGIQWLSPREAPEVPGQGCCGTAIFEEIDDVGFIRDMVAQLIRQYPIDPKRVYVTGLSNGCAMAQRLAAEASDLFAGAACMSMYLLSDVPTSYTPIPVMEVHGTVDRVVEYQEGKWNGAIKNFEHWRIRNGCSGEGEVVWREGRHELLRASGCTNAADVALLSVFEAGHLPYEGMALDLNTSEMAWTFLKETTRR